MKQKYIVFLVVFFIAILTVFSVNVNAESDVEYTMIQIGANESNNTSSVNLILKEHPTENLTAIVKDKNYNDVNNVPVTWISSDTSVVTVDETGKLQALKVGKSTITAKVSEDITDTCEVTVYAEPYFTDFKNAKYETELVTNVENLKISNITLEKSNNYSYYFMITSDNKKPDLKLTKSGAIDHDAMSDKISFLSINNDENYLYTRKLAKYCELNKDIYLWVVQETKLQDWYYNTNKDFHPKENNWLGYIITLNNKRYFVAGDTDITEENEQVKCDVCFLPIGGTYTMTYQEAVTLTNKIKPQIVVPIHYKTIVGTLEDAKNFKEAIDKNIQCIIMYE